MSRMIRKTIFDGQILALDVAADGLEIVVNADENDRGKLAEDLGILSVDVFEATVMARPWRKSGVRLDGVIRATAQQNCVVTLDAVSEKIEESFSLRLLPEQELTALEETDEIVIDPEAEVDPPDPIVDGKIDVGAIVCEHLALGLNPYPRKEGQVFEDSNEDEPMVAEADETNSAFSVLNSLKKND